MEYFTNYQLLTYEVYYILWCIVVEWVWKYFYSCCCTSLVPFVINPAFCVLVAEPIKILYLILSTMYYELSVYIINIYNLFGRWRTLQLAQFKPGIHLLRSLKILQFQFRPTEESCNHARAVRKSYHCPAEGLIRAHMSFQCQRRPVHG